MTGFAAIANIFFGSDAVGLAAEATGRDKVGWFLTWPVIMLAIGLGVFIAAMMIAEGYQPFAVEHGLLYR